jgi:hypothetical protein
MAAAAVAAAAAAAAADADLPALDSLADEALLRLSTHSADHHAADRRTVHTMPALPAPPPRHVRSSLLTGGSTGCTPRVIMLGTTQRRPPAPPPPLPLAPSGLEEGAWRGLLQRAGDLRKQDVWKCTRRLETTRRLQRGMLQQLRAHRAAAAAQLQAEAAGREKEAAARRATAAADESTLAGRMERLCQQVVQSIDGKGGGRKGGSKAARGSGGLGILVSAGSALSRSGRRASYSSAGSASGGEPRRHPSSPGNGGALRSALKSSAGNSRFGRGGGMAAATPSTSQAGAAAAGAIALVAGSAAAPLSVSPTAAAAGEGGWPAGTNLLGLRSGSGRQAATAGQQQHLTSRVQGSRKKRSRQQLPAASGAGQTQKHHQQQAPAVPALEVRMGEHAYQAHRAAVETAKAGCLHLYKARAHEGRMQLLHESLAASGRPADGSGSPRQQRLPPGSGSSSTRGATTASVEDLALITMQQLVALLVRADVEPPEAAAGQGSSSESGGVNQQQQQQQEQSKPRERPREALALRLMAARSVAELVDAAGEHIAGVTGELQKWKEKQQEEEERRRLGEVAAAVRCARASREGAAGGLQQQSDQASGAAACGSSISVSAATDSRPAAGDQPTADDIHQPAPTAAAVESTTASAPSAAARRTSAAHLPSSCEQQQTHRAPPPPLEPPSPEELAAVPPPALPRILDVSREPARVLQVRLERVWGILGVPAAEGMAVVLRYSAAKSTAFGFESALAAWEACAAAVLQREGLLRRLLELRAATLDAQARRRATAGRARRASQRASALAAAAGVRVSDAGSGGGGNGAYLSRSSADADGTEGWHHPSPPACGMSLEAVGHLLWAFQVASHHLAEAARALRASTGQEELLVDSEPYPGAGAVGPEQLQVILQDAWALEQ